MMRILHGILTGIAALVVMAFAVGLLLEKYNNTAGNWRYFGWAQDTQSLDAIYKTQGVPIDAMAELSVPVDNIQRHREWAGSDEKALLLPVEIGRPQLWGAGFTSYAYQQNSKISQGGSCISQTVNILEIDLTTGAGTPIFDRRLFIPSYAYFEGENERLVFSLIVTEDTDNDKKYTCLDNAKFHIASLEDGTSHLLNRAFVPSQLSQIQFDSREQVFKFVERETVDGRVQIRIVKISLAGEIVSEETFPDLLTEAKAAFERTAND